jgi:hypothetical protein
MARVQLLTDDLLFGSRLQAELTAAGHAVSLGLTPDPHCEAVIADLTHDAPARLASLAANTQPVLAFYSHVEADVRAAAEHAGIELVVARSRMAREPVALVSRLLATAS